MNDDFQDVWKDILNLGLSALAHANRHATYADFDNGKWGELSILQAAHAAEMIFKARIAQEHPLLIFESLPKVSQSEGSTLTLDLLAEKGRTIQWSDIPDRLWATTGIKMPNMEIFKSFGYKRNTLQHFGILKNVTDANTETLNFIFKVVDPFIYQCWKLYAVDYDEDYDSYENFPHALMDRKIKFKVSPGLFDHYKDYSGTDSEDRALCKYIKDHYK